MAKSCEVRGRYREDKKIEIMTARLTIIWDVRGTRKGYWVKLKGTTPASSPAHGHSPPHGAAGGAGCGQPCHNFTAFKPCWPSKRVWLSPHGSNILWPRWFAKSWAKNGYNLFSGAVAVAICKVQFELHQHFSSTWHGAAKWSKIWKNQSIDTCRSLATLCHSQISSFRRLDHLSQIQKSQQWAKLGKPM